MDDPAVSQPFADLDRPPLSAAPLRRALTTTLSGRSAPAWRALDVVASTGSTNADVAERARAGEAEGYVLVADHQSAGRGRMTRTWLAPPRSALAMSVLLRPGDPDATGAAPVPAERWGWLGLLAGLAVVDALRHTCGVQAVLKWPNDVLVPDGGQLASPPGSPNAQGRPQPRLRKVCGILAEVALAPAAVAPAAGGTAEQPPPAVVVGIGLNVSQSEAELPVPTATSLALAGAAVRDRDTLARAVLRAFAVRYGAWRDSAGDPTSVLGDYHAVSATLGAHVRVERAGANGEPGPGLEGTAVDVDAEGRLVVEAGGVREAVAAGDVVHLRGADGVYG